MTAPATRRVQGLGRSPNDISCKIALMCRLSRYILLVCELTFFGLLIGGDNLRSDWVCHETISHVLAALMPPNRLAIEVSMRYGMRIGDVLSMRREDVVKGSWTYKEQKTGKRRRIRLSKLLQERLLSQSGRVYVFEGRLDWRKHRTRQAVYKDIRRAAKALRLAEHVSPHTARKIYAVDAYKRYGDIKQVQRLLNHSDEAVTMIYALADKLHQ